MTKKLLITVTLKDQVLQQHAFESERVRIGRHRACDVVLDNPAVSRVHAEITTDDDGVWIEDQGSANGVSVNGRRVQREALRDGDVVTIGKFSLHVVAAPERPSPARGSALSGREVTIRVPSGDDR